MTIHEYNEQSGHNGKLYASHIEADKVAGTDSGAAPSVDLTDGYWNEHELISVSDFRDLETQYGGGMIRRHFFERCELENDEARYFCAVNGECFGLICRNSDGSCLAEIETALGYASKGYRYTTFALKSRTPAALKAWRSKWSKRTRNDARVSMFDASVRGSV